MKTSDAIARYPGVQGGYPVIAGTRTPVRSIVELYYNIYPFDIEEVHRALSHLSLEQIRAALDYYDAEPELVDEDTERQKQALREILTVNMDVLSQT